jgi:hypothetical protein
MSNVPSYQTNNFTALNKAVEQESIKQENLNNLTKTIKSTYLIAAVVGILAIIFLLICIYKLLSYDFTPQIVEKPIIVEKPKLVTPEIDYNRLAELVSEIGVTSKPIENFTETANQPNESVNDALIVEAELTRQVDTFSSQEAIPEEEKAFIETSFTIFHSTIIPSGETLVTGKEYSPEDVSTPLNQYCYLRSTIDESSIRSSIIDLANFKNGKISYYTEDKFFNDLVDQYCVFK